MAERDLRRKLFWLIAIRVGISSLLLGSAVVVQLTSPGIFPGEPLFLLIGVTYALNILWALTLKWAERYRWIVDVQLACDALIVSGFIAVTGGITSYFAALYVLPIAAASSVQFRRGGMMIAVLSALLYVGIVATQYFGLAGMLGFPLFDRSGPLPPLRIVVYTTGLNVFLFFSIAFLSGSLADRLQRAGARLERASSEIADLQAFNQHVIDSLASGLATTDRLGRILTFNRAAEAITGHSAHAVVGRRLEEVLELPPNVAVNPSLLSKYDEIMLEEQYLIREIDHLRADIKQLDAEIEESEKNQIDDTRMKKKREVLDREFELVEKKRMYQLIEKDYEREKRRYEETPKARE